MKKSFLFFSIVLLIAFAGVASARPSDDPIDIASFAKHPEDFEGRVVEVTAQVLAVNADSRSLELFDSQSRVSIDVRLQNLRRAARTALMRNGVRRVTVSGRATVVGGRLVINAQRIVVLPLNNETTCKVMPEARTRAGQ